MTPENQTELKGTRLKQEILFSKNKTSRHIAVSFYLCKAVLLLPIGHELPRYRLYLQPLRLSAWLIISNQLQSVSHIMSTPQASGSTDVQQLKVCTLNR